MNIDDFWSIRSPLYDQRRLPLLSLATLGVPFVLNWTHNHVDDVLVESDLVKSPFQRVSRLFKVQERVYSGDLVVELSHQISGASLHINAGARMEIRREAQIMSEGSDQNVDSTIGPARMRRRKVA